MRVVRTSGKMMSIVAGLEIALASGGAASSVTETPSLTEKVVGERQGIFKSLNRPLVALLALALCSNCASASAGKSEAVTRRTPPPGMTKLTGASLTRLVAGAAIIRRPDETPGVIEVPDQVREVFLRNGEYSSVVDRARINGKYKTDKGVLCVYVIGSPARCRYIYTDAKGRFFEEWPSRRGILFEIGVVK
jgi:hypothetical protein